MHRRSSQGKNPDFTRAMLGLGGVFIGAGVFMTLSKGGILALAIGLALLATMAVSTHAAASGPKRWRAALVPGALAAILALSLWLGYQAILEEFRHLVPEDSVALLGKAGLWPSALAMIRAHAWVGVGRGAFFTTFPRYLHGDVTLGRTYSHLENQYLHLLAEWGVPVGSAVLIGAAVALGYWIYRGRRSPTVAALACSLIALAAHNVVDFNLELLGIALPAAGIAGALSASVQSRRRRKGKNQRSAAEAPPPAAKPRLLALAPSAVLAAFGLIAAFASFPSAQDDGRTLASLARQEAPLERFRAAAYAAIDRHPADYLPQLAMARAAMRTRRPEALAWLNRALFLFPDSPQIHLETANALLRFGHRKQALVQTRLALIHDAPAQVVLKWALPLCRDLEELQSMVPAEPDLQALAGRLLLTARRAPLADGLLAAARRRWPQHADIAVARVDALLATGAPKAALAEAESVARQHPSPNSMRRWARAARQTEGPESAVRVLTRAQQQFPDAFVLRVHLSRAQLAAGHPEQAQAVAEQMLKDAVTPRDRAAAHSTLAQIYHASGRKHRAQYETEQAHRVRQGQ